jgi:hypothetical protein
MLADLAALVDDATAAFEGFDYARALERTEAFFWWFCDDYLELVKLRAYGDGGARRLGSERAGASAVVTLQRLLAPFLPFATEEATARWQFGITTVYHFFMVPLTIGLALVVAWVAYFRPVGTAPATRPISGSPSSSGSCSSSTSPWASSPASSRSSSSA